MSVFNICGEVTKFEKTGVTFSPNFIIPYHQPYAENLKLKVGFKIFPLKEWCVRTRSIEWRSRTLEQTEREKIIKWISEMYADVKIGFQTFTK